MIFIYSYDNNIRKYLKDISPRNKNGEKKKKKKQKKFLPLKKKGKKKKKKKEKTPRLNYLDQPRVLFNFGKYSCH